LLTAVYSYAAIRSEDVPGHWGEYVGPPWGVIPAGVWFIAYGVVGLVRKRHTPSE
jgi:hypothetical protein